MRLKTQLLLVSLLTLALPWAGCQYVREMESAQQRSQQDILLGSASVVATALRDRPDLLVPRAHHSADQREPTRELFAHYLTKPPYLNGSATDWTPQPPAISLPESIDPSIAASDFAVSYRAAFDQRALYVFVEVRDQQIVYRDPLLGERSPHDHVVLSSTRGDARALWLFSTAAPGEFSAFEYRGARDEQDDPPVTAQRVRGYWRDRAEGYILELRIPLELVGERVGLAALDAEGGAYTGVAGTMAGLDAAIVRNASQVNYLAGRPDTLVFTSLALNDRLAQFQQTDKRLRIVDRAGWAIATSGSLSPPDSDQKPQSIALERIFRALLNRERQAMPSLETNGPLPPVPAIARALNGEPVVTSYRTVADDEVVIAAVHPIMDREQVVGAALLEQRSDAILTLTQPALTRLISLTLFTSFLAAGALLGYATLLSYRIRKLRNAAERALSPEGTLSSNMPGDAAGDELGDLSRSFSTLLERLREHNEYLRGLAGKLSHELRTPLAVVRSSLENMQHEALPPGAEPYAQRASEGITRLSATLTAMSEASRVEQSLESAETEQFNLTDLVSSMANAYRDVYTECRIEAQVPASACHMAGVPELLVQMLDKLVDNAADFSPAQGRIIIQLKPIDKGYEISVSNDGPLLPEKMRGKLFDSLVSVRESTSGDRPHLGFGLHIARLIAEFHNGHIRAKNRDDGSGVVFTTYLAA